MIDFTNCDLNTIWANLIVEELIRNEVVYFCISPGSRSTPLTVAVARHPQARKIVHFDERGAAFHALGYARATGRPAVLICTSGTAAANYFPAVIEAAVDFIPMLILSADRPPELQDSGANQTIRQFHLYGDYVRWQHNLPPPDENIKPAMLLTVIDQAVYQATRQPAGPAHVNCMFREPLAPTGNGSERPDYGNDLEHWLKSRQPKTIYPQTIPQPNAKDLTRIAAILNKPRPCLVIVGKLDVWTERKPVLDLARALDAPLWPDITSGLRLGLFDESAIIPYYDQLLLEDPFISVDSPGVVLYIGGQVVSKRLLQFLEKGRYDQLIRVKPYPDRHDSSGRVTLAIESDIGAFCGSLSVHIQRAKIFGWNSYFRNLSDAIDQNITAFLNRTESLTEIAVARIVSANIPAGDGLFLASSMPVRDMDMFGTAAGAVVPVGANRGASGIDGTIAAAAGFAVGLDKPVTLIIGDLAFLHDLNSLSLLKNLPQRVIIVVINNNGGGIFHFLPIVRHTDVFETYFGAPHGLGFGDAARLFNLEYAQPLTQADFESAYREALLCSSSTLIEIKTDRAENLQTHQRLQDTLKNRLQSATVRHSTLSVTKR